jgi:uncharacterized membrane protein
MRKLFTIKEFLPIVLIIFSIIVGFLIYPLLPQEIPTHWNARGMVDNLMNKNLAVLFFPLLTFSVYLLMTFIPFIDPYKRNYLKFADHYFWFKTATVIFLILIYFFSLWVARGVTIDVAYFVVPVVSAFISYIGFFFTKVKRNYFVGIRTPWTLYSEKVWDKTHDLGGRVMVVAAVISLLSLLNIKYAFVIFTSVIIIAVCIPIVYSYFFFKKEKKK